MLIETGSLDRGGGVLRLTRPLREIATPESVREVVSQRLARLDAGTRDLLELAAVAGSEFELEVLRRAAPRELEHLDALQPAVAQRHDRRARTAARSATASRTSSSAARCTTA